MNQLKVDHYTFIQAICDADYRLTDLNNPFLAEYSCEYLIQLHECMERREQKTITA